MPTVCENLIETKKKLESDIQNIYLPNLNSSESTARGWLTSFANDYSKYTCGKDVWGGSGIDALLANARNGTRLNPSFCKGGSINCSKDGCVNRINNSVNPALQKYSDDYSAWSSATKSLSDTISQIATNGGCAAESKAATTKKAAQSGLYIVIGVVIVVGVYILYKVLKTKGKI